VKVCDESCIFSFFPIINKNLCMAKRSLLSERPSYFAVCVTGNHILENVFPGMVFYIHDT